MKAWLTLIVTAAFFVAPLITPPFTGYTDGQLPIAQPNPPVQPAGYAFALWGVIYSWLAASAIFGVLKRSDDTAWDAARPALIVSIAVGAAWLWVALASPIWATILIWVMLAGALVALFHAPRKDIWWFAAPVGLYAGWLTAAANVSLGVAGAGYGLFFGAEVWALICIALALLIALGVIWTAPFVLTYGAAVVWALIGILVANGLDLTGGLAIAGCLAVAGGLLAALRGKAIQE
ncbi:hypothetical protein [Nereida sp. MMG025]|uniref:hypothetical protein n=1 Tax=Nereida sp. MMG025 TaxID=2909981 RepID=UPI001F48E350|nr:hypothetical protein [Nereida sp. MMG025]MCF6445421.1 hypothetical protein [Nereida sp. MMG025]